MAHSDVLPSRKWNSFDEKSRQLIFKTQYDFYQVNCVDLLDRVEKCNDERDPMPFQPIHRSNTEAETKFIFRFLFCFHAVSSPFSPCSLLIKVDVVRYESRRFAPVRTNWSVDQWQTETVLHRTNDSDRWFHISMGKILQILFEKNRVENLAFTYASMEKSRRTRKELFSASFQAQLMYSIVKKILSLIESIDGTFASWENKSQHQRLCLFFLHSNVIREEIDRRSMGNRRTETSPQCIETCHYFILRFCPWKRWIFLISVLSSVSN